MEKANNIRFFICFFVLFLLIPLASAQDTTPPEITLLNLTSEGGLGQLINLSNPQCNQICNSGMSGSNTSQEPCLITTCTQLQNVSMDLDGNYALANNIDCSALARFNSLGNSFSNTFDGTFDGRRNTINGVSVNRTATYAGLFGRTGVSSKIRNVRLVNITVTSTFSAVGGLVGESQGNITNSSVENSSIIGGSNTGGLLGRSAGGIYIELVFSDYVNVTGSSASAGVGGLIGQTAGITYIKNSYAKNATVNGSQKVGGLVGDHVDSLINSSYSTGTVYADNNGGGLVGYADSAYVTDGSTITRSFTTAKVFNNGTYVNTTMGLLGNSVNQLSLSSNNILDIGEEHYLNNSYWFNHTDDDASSCYGDANGTGNIGCFNITSSVSYFYNLSKEPYSSWNFNVWNNTNNNTGYPVLDWQLKSGISTPVSSCRNISRTNYTTPTFFVITNETGTCAIIDNNRDLNWTDIFAGNANNDSGAGGTTHTLTLNLSNQTGIGLHNFSVGCKDAVGNENRTSTSSKFLVNITEPIPPQVNLANPDADALFRVGVNTTNIRFNVTSTDNYNRIYNCTGYIDSVQEFSNGTYANGTQFNFSKTITASGIHTWNVTCIDNFNNVNSSQRSFTVILDGGESAGGAGGGGGSGSSVEEQLYEACITYINQWQTCYYRDGDTCYKGCPIGYKCKGYICELINNTSNTMVLEEHSRWEAVKSWFRSLIDPSVPFSALTSESPEMSHVSGSNPILEKSSIPVTIAVAVILAILLAVAIFFFGFAFVFTNPLTLAMITVALLIAYIIIKYEVFA